MSLDFETCSALKKAGFPQPIVVSSNKADWMTYGDGEKATVTSFNVDDGFFGGVFVNGELEEPQGAFTGEIYRSSIDTRGDPPELVYCPTIEDLLRELGEEFEGLHHTRAAMTPRDWCATSLSAMASCSNDTPEQALANLYLAKDGVFHVLLASPDEK